jgi:hypothetical protein
VAPPEVSPLAEVYPAAEVAGGGTYPAAVAVAVEDPAAVEAPAVAGVAGENGGLGTGTEGPVTSFLGDPGTAEAGPPAPSGPKQSWVDYAVSQGATADEAAAMTKADLMSRYGGRL